VKYLLNLLFPFNMIIHEQYEDIRRRSESQDGKDVSRATSSMSFMCIFDYIPLPRSILLLIVYFLIQRAENNYRDTNYDAGGYGGSTFGEVKFDLLLRFIFILPFEIVLSIVIYLYI
jgi:hypothetical protein